MVSMQSHGTVVLHTDHTICQQYENHLFICAFRGIEHSCMSRFLNVFICVLWHASCENPEIVRVKRGHLFVQCVCERKYHPTIACGVACCNCTCWHGIAFAFVASSTANLYSNFLRFYAFCSGLRVPMPIGWHSTECAATSRHQQLVSQAAHEFVDRSASCPMGE